ncbi:hypothetical protein KsCSTR_01060 [Candidatus Kuenenia stuttgartiensis]|jgi:hypothetical protein|uniref:Uncharacterized protein n=1 Tax=Kuenenia stuttgartiensis TaxID=174633 RepID=A0A6G7GIZ6_KUEST|nr:hypothetical protein KsCSTR_01060 [Candidatus Kuenenia stuttgartiensis]
MDSAPGRLIANTCDFKEYVGTHCMRLYKNIEIPRAKPNKHEIRNKYKIPMKKTGF